MSSQTATEKDQTSGVIPTARWRVKALTVLSGYRLAVTFFDGTSRIANLSGICTAEQSGVYEGLKSLDLFNQASIDLGVVTWPNGADLDPAWMHEQIKKINRGLPPFNSARNTYPTMP